MKTAVKICGITDAAGMNAALRHSADLVGIVCRKDSPRFVGFESAVRLAELTRGRAQIVCVVADADDEFLGALASKVKPDIFQLHGGETPRRVTEIFSRFQIPLIKTLGIADESDLAALASYEPLTKKILLEAKAPDGKPHGGSGRSFDWKLLRTLPRRNHIMLAGGLNPDNVGNAIATAGVRSVDVASGVESAPGIKDEAKIAAFIQNARAAFSALAETAA